MIQTCAFEEKEEEGSEERPQFGGRWKSLMFGGP
jgi:hypothetical protein